MVAIAYPLLLMPLEWGRGEQVWPLGIALITLFQFCPMPLLSDLLGARSTQNYEILANIAFQPGFKRRGD